MLTAKGSDTPQPIPAVPMPRRRLIRIQNFGYVNEMLERERIRIVIGDRDIEYTTGPGSRRWGHGLDFYEWIEIPIDDTVDVFGIIMANQTGDEADIRTLELA